MALNQGKKKPHGLGAAGFACLIHASVLGGMFYAMPGVDALGLGGHVPSPRNGLKYMTCTQLCGLLDTTDQLRRTSCALELIDDALQRRRVVFAQYDTLFSYLRCCAASLGTIPLIPFLPCGVRACLAAICSVRALMPGGMFCAMPGGASHSALTTRGAA